MILSADRKYTIKELQDMIANNKMYANIDVKYKDGKPVMATLVVSLKLKEEN